MDPSDESFGRLSCPALQGSRYNYLRESNAANLTSTAARPKYFFALNLHQCAPLLPRLLGSIVETISYLGTDNCVLSIVEGRSDDGTYEVLYNLQAELEKAKIKHIFKTSAIDPLQPGGDRIQALAALRQMALRPLVDHPDHFSSDATIIFLNDVAICMEDILELIHKRVYLEAHQTCAMDWTYVGSDPTFYDVWIARGMKGDSFFNIPEDGNWNSAWNLFWNDAQAATAYAQHKPFPGLFLLEWRHSSYS